VPHSSGISRLHPLIDTGARPQFLTGQREQAVVASIRAAQVRVRRLAGPGNDATGAGLMTRALGPGGRLTGPPAVKAEQEGTRALLPGADAVPRNPPGHRQVDDDDGSAAAEAAQAASLLKRSSIASRILSGRSPEVPGQVVDCL
jgi:hypothetical protein